VVHKLPIQYGVNANYVLVDLWLNFVRYVVVNRVPHVFREHIFEAFLVEHVIIKYLHHHIQEAFELVSIETYLEYLVRPVLLTRLRLELILAVSLVLH
jgi:hypothetical protein